MFYKESGLEKAESLSENIDNGFFLSEWGLFLSVACVVVWPLGLYSATFLTPSPHYEHKGLPRDILRDSPAWRTQISGKNTEYQRTCNMITSISNADLHETMAAGYREEVEHCGKCSPHSAPIRPTQGASINTSAPSIQIPQQLLSCILTNVMVMSKFLCKCTLLTLLQVHS